MYSLGIHDLQEKSRKAQEAKLRRHQSSQGQSVQRRDFVLSSVWEQRPTSMAIVSASGTHFELMM